MDDSGKMLNHKQTLNRASPRRCGCHGAKPMNRHYFIITTRRGRYEGTGSPFLPRTTIV